MWFCDIGLSTLNAPTSHQGPTRHPVSESGYDSETCKCFECTYAAWAAARVTVQSVSGAQTRANDGYCVARKAPDD
jgi:hypothetical protein